MPSHFNIPFCWPFKMVPVSKTPGIHFDDAWACEQILSFQYRMRYQQKWQWSDTTRLQIESSVAPDGLKIYNRNRQVVYTIGWTPVYTGTNYTIWELTFDLSAVGLADGIYFLYQRAAMLDVVWEAISEPISIKAKHTLTNFIKYRHHMNDYGVAWSTGIEMGFRVECAIMDYDPQAERTMHVNQIKDVKLLNGIPSRKFKFYVGREPGVPPYIVDILNFIFCCSYVNIQGKLYQSDGDWEVVRVEKNPHIGASIDIVPATNMYGLQFSKTEPLAPGLVTAYNIETGFFGPKAIVPVIEVQENS